MSRRAVLIVVTLLAVVGMSLLLTSGVLWIRSVEATIVTDDGEELAATLAVPRRRPGPHPAAIIVHGSGAVTARELRSYARRLVGQGMAVLMFDKRGAGGSTGSLGAIAVAQSEEKLGRLADDVSAAVDWLVARDDIDRARVGLVGGSQAGWVMPLAAVRNRAVRYIVAIAGPAVSYGEEIYFSRLTGDDPGPYGDLEDEEIARRFAQFDGPRGYDPGPTLAGLDIPSLWILGGADRSVPSAASVAVLERLNESGQGRFDIALYPQGDHSIRDAHTGRRIDYWSRIGDWLHDNDFAGD